MTNSIEEQGEVYNAIAATAHVYNEGWQDAIDYAQEATNKYFGSDGDRARDAAWLRYLAEQSMSTTDLWNALEKVLQDKGASDAWLRYAMPDLHTMAMQFGLGEFHRGYVAHERGEGCGAYDPPRVGSEQSLQELADADQAEFEDLREAFVAGYRSGNQYDRGADFSDTEFADWVAKREAEPSTPLHILVPSPYAPPWTSPNNDGGMGG